MTERLLLLAVGLGIALRIGWLLYTRPNPLEGQVDDSRFYLLSARSLATSGAYDWPTVGSPTAEWPPGYSLLLAGLYKFLSLFKLVGAGDGWVLDALIDAGRAVNILAAAITIVLVYAIGRRVFDQRVGLVGAFLVAIFPGQIFFTASLMTETLFTTMVLGVVYGLIRLKDLDRTPSIWMALSFGVVLGVTVLFRGEGILLLGLGFLFWRLLVPSWRIFAWQAALLVVGAAAIISPWTARNWVTMGAFVPVSDGFCHQLWHGHQANSYEFLATLESIARITAPYQNLAGPERELQSEKAFCREAYQFIRQEPVQESQLLVQRAYQFIRDDKSGLDWIQLHTPITGAEHFARVANLVYFTTMALAVAGTPAWWSRQPKLLLLIAVIGGWFLLHMALYPLPRYHHPLVPIVSLLAAAGLVALWQQSRRLTQGEGHEEREQ